MKNPSFLRHDQLAHFSNLEANVQLFKVEDALDPSDRFWAVQQIQGLEFTENVFETLEAAEAEFKARVAQIVLH